MSQEFVAGDVDEEWNNADGEKIDPPENAVYQPFIMEQPKVAWAGR